MVGAGRHADAALPAFPGGDHDAGLAVGQVFHLEGVGPAGFFALAAAKALVCHIGQVVAVAQGCFHGGLELFGALVEQQAEIHAGVLLVPQAGQLLQQLFGAGFGALGQLFHHLPAGQFLDVIGSVLQLIGQGEPGLEHGRAKEFHQPGEFLAQLLGAQVVLALAAGGQI